jgi:hypothetical protein
MEDFALNIEEAVESMLLVLKDRESLYLKATAGQKGGLQNNGG